MKKLVVIALALITLNGMAQEKRNQSVDREELSEFRKDMTPNEIAGLKSKQMTLQLDLTDKQQSKVHSIILTHSETNQNLRKESKGANDDQKEKRSKDDFVKMQNHRLDQKIEMKREMKAILSPEQYAKFEKMRPRQHRKKGNHKKKQ